MRPDIHPDYREVLFHDTSVDEYFIIGSTLKTNETKKWKDGKTGFPIVDAGMRELNKTGYMHNRARLITATEDAFSHLKRVNNENSKGNIKTLLIFYFI